MDCSHNVAIAVLISSIATKEYFIAHMFCPKMRVFTILYCFDYTFLNPLIIHMILVLTLILRPHISSTMLS